MSETLKNSWKRIRIWAVILSICILLLGVVMVIWPKVSALAICIILGILCIAMGVVDIVRYFKLGLAGIFFRYDLIWSILSILIGVLMLVRASDAVAFLPIAVGIYMIMGSILCIQLAVELHRLHSSSWVLALIWGILGAVLACLLLLDPFGGANILMVFVGAALIVGGVQDLYLVMSISKAIKEAKKDVVIEVNGTNAD